MYRRATRRITNRRTRFIPRSNEYDYPIRHYEPEYYHEPSHSYREDSRRDRVGFGKSTKESCLTDDELYDFISEKYNGLDENHRKYLSKDNVKQIAESKGIHFGKFTFEELYAVILMLFEDYHKLLGESNVGLYVCLAKDWLCDEDACLKYGEKLAAYYDHIIVGEY